MALKNGIDRAGSLKLLIVPNEYLNGKIKIQSECAHYYYVVVMMQGTRELHTTK